MGGWACTDRSKITISPTNPTAASLGRPLRSFCAAFLDTVQLYMSERFETLWRSVKDSTLACELGLQLAVTFMISRKASDDEYRDESIHADAFDGTVIGLAMLCSKMGARLFPDAVFVQAPVEQFIKESSSGSRHGFSPVTEGGHGVMRTLSPGAILIMPAAVAHARPDGRVEDYPPAGPRWFARAHMELRPASGRCAWDSIQRMWRSRCLWRSTYGGTQCFLLMQRSNWVWRSGQRKAPEGGGSSSSRPGSRARAPMAVQLAGSGTGSPFGGAMPIPMRDAWTYSLCFSTDDAYHATYGNRSALLQGERLRV